MDEKSAIKGANILASIQFVLHYLALIGIIGGIIAFLFSNTERAIQLIVGGVCIMILKYVLGFIFVPILLNKSFKDVIKDNINKDS